MTRSIGLTKPDFFAIFGRSLGLRVRAFSHRHPQKNWGVGLSNRSQDPNPLNNHSRVKSDKTSDHVAGRPGVGGL